MGYASFFLAEINSEILESLSIPILCESMHSKIVSLFFSTELLYQGHSSQEPNTALIQTS